MTNYTPAQVASINRHLAEKVMEYRKEQASDNWPGLVGWMCWFDGDLPMMRVREWHPYTDPAQAILCAEKMMLDRLWGYDISYAYGFVEERQVYAWRYRATLSNGVSLFEGIHETLLAAALSVAVGKATGWEP